MGSFCRLECRSEVENTTRFLHCTRMTRPHPIWKLVLFVGARPLPNAADGERSRKFMALNEAGKKPIDQARSSTVRALRSKLAQRSSESNKLETMELGDRVVGFLLLLFSITLFSYYTFWVIITPFVDSDHFIHSYFPARYFAIIIPVLAGVVLLSFLLIFVGVVLLRSRKSKAKTA